MLWLLTSWLPSPQLIKKTGMENHQCSFYQEGYGYVPADIQVRKSHIAIPEYRFVEG
jgi:hypothetical protein